MPWDPFSKLASTAAQIVTDAWTAMWLSVWNAGLWLLRLILQWMDAWLVPDLSADGPAHDLYQVTFWIAGVMVMILLVVQIGIAAGRRDGKGLARAGIGLAQFAVITGAWVGYTVLVTAAVGGLTRAVMESLLGVTSWNSWQPWTSFDTKQVTDARLATVLGFLGLFMWIAAIGHLLVILARDAALMVLVATGPIAAAGLVNETTRAWFWKAFRWFHAAVVTPLLVVVVTGVGMKFAEGVAVGKAGTVEASVGTIVPAAALICIAAFSPVALFKLLAFVDPGTASGASMRAGMQATGGLQGLLAGKPAATASDDTAAKSSGGRSAGEASADAATTARVAGAVQQAGSFLGPVGAGLAAGLGAMARVGTVGTSVLTDLTNQEGVGHNTYQPDYQDGRRDGAARANREANSQPQQTQGSPTTSPNGPSTDPGPTAPSAGANGAAGSGGGAGAGTSAGAGGGAAAAEVAVVAL
jgi:hypothetical protein